MRPIAIILHFDGESEWSFRTIGPDAGVLNFGCGYFTPELALIQAKIFVIELPDGTLGRLPGYPAAITEEIENGTTKESIPGDGQGSVGPQAGS